MVFKMIERQLKTPLRQMLAAFLKVSRELRKPHKPAEHSKKASDRMSSR